MNKSNKYPQSQQKMTKNDVAMLIKTVGPGASLIIDFHKTDFERGSMRTAERERCFWTTDGNRVTFILSTDNGILASQSQEPDPDRPDVAFPGYDGN